MLVTAGLHGSEYSAIEAVYRLVRLPLIPMAGSLILFPIVNVAGYFSNSVYVNPVDRKNLNRVFPGNRSGSQSERIADWMVRSLFPNVDIFLDLHAGDLNEQLTPFTMFRHDGEGAAALAGTFALPFSVPVRGEGHAHAAAVDLGVPAILAEAGGNGLVSKGAIALLYDGVLRVLAASGMHDGPTEKPATRMMSGLTTVNSPCGGRWRPERAAGQAVRREECLGTILDVLDLDERQIKAPSDGVIMFMMTSLAVNRGDCLIGIAGSP